MTCNADDDLHGMNRAARRRVDRGLSSQSPWVDQAWAADYLGVDVRTIRNWVSSGKIQGYRCGRNAIRLRRDDLDAVMVPFGGGA